MELRNFFKNSSNEIYEQNMDLLEDYDLINTFGSPNKLFLKFLNSKNLEIKKDELTVELIEEFENSVDSLKIKSAKIQKEKETIFSQRQVWINIPSDDELEGTNLILDFDSITIESTDQKINYTDILDIEITEGSWSKNRFTIQTEDNSITFEINEDRAIPLKEIIEDNIENQNHDEIDDLLELYVLFEEGKISEEEFELRKAVIYSDDEYCTNCGEKIEKDSKFCQNCGYEVI